MTSLTLLSNQINQVDNLYSLNDLHKASGDLEKHQPSYFVRNQEVKDLTQEIMQSANLQSGQVLRKVNGGEHRGTYGCKEIVYRYAMWISPKFALAVIRVFDTLVTGNLEPRRITISVEQQKAIRFAVARRANGNKPHFQTVYTAMYEHFNIPRYAELLVSDFDEAIKFIQTVDLTPQIEMSKPFEMQEFSVTSQVVEYLQALRREITRLGGVIPTYPTFDDETIVQSVVTRMVQSHRMMLSFDPLDGARIKLIPQNNWLVTEENIASIIGNADGIRKDKLPDIMSALLSRIGLTK